MKLKFATGALLATGILLLAANPAAAATGKLELHNASIAILYTDPPKGCHGGPGAGTTVSNRTDSRVLLFPDERCLSRVYWPVEPGEVVRGRNVGSVQVLH
ncbi:hypothetical protein DP939_34175 [Spongiactinospora rosea]|uniref:Secreted protein n=1 Tax=Spongiactinospora rosea TaxID=2248750 RepID=A0A366LP93_9ACTN|nr:hypothetical protein [Spongiactinospora rosea]RBQ15731.1 hypothetical protein DP939_34175 [Spongiactinospora rosea]